MTTPEINSNRYNPEHNIDECEISLTFGNDRESPGQENPSSGMIFNTSNDVLDVNSSPIKKFIVPRNRVHDTQRIGTQEFTQIINTQTQKLETQNPQIQNPQIQHPQNQNENLGIDETQKIEEPTQDTINDQDITEIDKIDTQADSQPVETQYVVTDTQVDKGEKINFADFDTQPLKQGSDTKDDLEVTGDTRDLNLVEETQRITLDESSMIETQPVVRGMGEILQLSSPKAEPVTDPLQIDTDNDLRSDPRSDSNEIQIPGTVDRDRIREFSRMQVINTQESIIAEHAEEEEVNTEDETTLPIDDSLLTHKLKRERRLEEDSPFRESWSKRRKPNGMLFGSDSGEPSGNGNISDDCDRTGDGQESGNGEEGADQESEDVQMDSAPLAEPLANAMLTPEILRNEPNLAITASQVNFRRSVWAEHNFKMHTGEIQTTGKTTLEVMFIDGPLKVPNTDLSPLDIRIGDKVTLKEDRIKYIVSGLSANPATDLKCIRGYNTVHLQRAGRRKYAEKMVNLAEVRMDLDDWFTHQQKFSVDFSVDDSLGSIIQANMRTPTRTRHTQDAKSPVKKAGGILEDCIFCITAIKDKDKLLKMIILNGGEVLDDGFMHLFEYQQTPRFELVANYEGLKSCKFAALISNHYSRSSKYLQTVALGWPIVSQRFIMDLIEEKCDFEAWPSYLLAAGLSSVLKTTKSLDIFKFRNGYNLNYLLDKQIGLNGHVLRDKVILSLDKGEKQEMLETSEFIFYAFGVKHFSHFTNVNDMKKFIKNRKFSSGEILIYCNTREVEKYRVVDWEWVVQCCIGGIIWE